MTSNSTPSSKKQRPFPLLSKRPIPLLEVQTSLLKTSYNSSKKNVKLSPPIKHLYTNTFTTGNKTQTFSISITPILHIKRSALNPENSDDKQKFSSNKRQDLNYSKTQTKTKSTKPSRNS